MSHYYPRYVSGLDMPYPQEQQLHKHSIWYPRSHKRLYTTQVESRLSLLSTCVVYSRL